MHLIFGMIEQLLLLLSLKIGLMKIKDDALVKLIFFLRMVKQWVVVTVVKKQHFAFFFFFFSPMIK